MYFVLHEHFSKYGNSTCLITEDGKQWTYDDIDRLSGQFASVLLNNDVVSGDRIVVQVEKSVGAVALYLGCLRIGAIYVPLNTAYTASEIAYFLEDADPRVFICHPDTDIHELTALCDNSIETILKLGRSSEDHLWHEVLQLSPYAEIVESKADDIAALIYTSGTTGRSKGAMIPHKALTSNALSLHELWGFEEGDVLLHALPIYHIHGLFVALHTAMLNGSRIIFLNQFSVQAVRENLPETTVLMGVPTFYHRLLEGENFNKQECENVRLFISGSAPLTEQSSNAWKDLTGHRILERYGMTEAGMITSNPLHGDRVPGSVGYALPGVEVKVCDEAGDELPNGEIGCIEVRGPNLFSGYWRQPEKTAEEIRENGFFITGDLGTMDKEGRLCIVGRAKDLIISGGFNIYPKEIESVLDDIEGIVESAVIGVPHSDVGEGVVAVLVPVAEPLDVSILANIIADKLARFKHPRKFFWINELPRNAMGKVQKNVLCEKYHDAYDE